ncbi:hypothetical protein BASA81_000632 [Batrachochytrium salamandrivorans]|nr:hypothetical protein BASA81_000632 [Batrachochytrium salamandrivorans]
MSKKKTGEGVVRQLLQVTCGNGQEARVLKLDKQFIAVEKPHGILSQPDITNDESLDESVKKFLVKHYEKPGNAFAAVVHRLDRPASGVMLLATTSKAASRLAKQFRDHTIHKEYLAVVSSSKLHNRTDGIIKGSDALAAGTGEGGEWTSSNKLQQGDLEWTRVRDVGNLFSVLRIKIQTGTKHQIRSQLCVGGIGPIVGDVKYGYHGALPHHFPATGAVMLHANRLEFDHPITNERIRLSCPPNSWPKAFWPAYFKAGEEEDVGENGEVKEDGKPKKTTGKRTKLFT